MKYLDGDTVAQCHELLRQGRTLEELAGRLHIDPEVLARLLGLPSIKPIPAVTDGGNVDLWRTDLDEQL